MVIPDSVCAERLVYEAGNRWNQKTNDGEVFWKRGCLRACAGDGFIAGELWSRGYPTDRGPTRSACPASLRHRAQDY